MTIHKMTIHGEVPLTEDEIAEIVSVQTQAQIVSELTAAVQEHLDTKARERSYDGILSLCTYAAGSNERFVAEGQAGVEWREAVWARCYEVLAECQAGTRAVPTPEELIAMLPTFVWPV